MRRLLAALFVLIAGLAAAQDFTGLARVDVAQSQVRDEGQGVEMRLALSQPVPWRVFLLAEPPRLVADFREVDWAGVRREALLNADGVEDLRFGALRPGWSRLVLSLAGPMEITSAGMTVDQVTSRAVVTVQADPVPEAEFAALVGAPDDPDWTDAAPLPAPEPRGEGPLVVAIDPGHGGIDPGAERDGLREADLMLLIAEELAEEIARSDGMVAVLTRESDHFVPLELRVSLARAAGADLFISLHADALEEDVARGASVYTLSDEGQDGASQRMAERHERADLLAGMDLSGQDDTVSTILMDLARLETAPASERLAQFLVKGLGDTGAALNTRPRREARLAVLAAPDFPSVLVEVGFLSDDQDRDRLTSPEGRRAVVQGLLRGIQIWAADEEARAPLIRQ